MRERAGYRYTVSRRLTPPAPQVKLSGRFHALGADDRVRHWCFKEIRQCVGGFGHRGVDMPAGGKQSDLLDVLRQPANNIDAGHRQQFTHLLKADFDLATRNARAYGFAFKQYYFL